MFSKPFSRIGESMYQQMDKINAEVLAMTYGALVTQLLQDFQVGLVKPHPFIGHAKDVNLVNQELERMGFSIGTRLVEEFLAKTNMLQCKSMKDTAGAIAKVAFRMFLGVSAEVANWSEDKKEFSLVFTDNPLELFVALPSEYRNKLHYSNMLCGVIRGAVQMLQLVVECRFVASELNGQPAAEIRVKLKEVLKEQYKDEEE